MLILVKRVYLCNEANIRNLHFQRGDLVKLFHKSEKKDTAYLMLKEDIEKTTSDLRAAYTNLENVVDPDLIDYYIYQAKAAQMRYKFLLSCVKKLEDS